MQCVNPKKIEVKNKVNHVVLVPCGHCYACEQNKRAEWTYRITRESEGHFCIFLTLTYDDANLPIFTSRNFAQMRLHEESKKSYEKRFYGDVCYLRKQDFSDFLKACQKALKQHFNDKTLLFRYVLNGEYGDTSKRCHGHVLFMFPTSLTKSQCIDFCEQYFGFAHDYTNKTANAFPDPHKCFLWRNGNVVTQYSYETNHVGAYVSKHCVKSCDGTQDQKCFGKIFRLTSTYKGGIGVNVLCNDKKVQQAYQQEKPLKTFGDDGTQYLIPIPRACKRRFHPENYDDAELSNAASKAFQKYENSVYNWFYSSSYSLANQDVPDFEQLEKFYNHEMRVADNKHRIDVERRRLQKKHPKKGH